MNTTAADWRPLTPADLPAVEAIAADVHPDFFEEPAVFAERQRLYPNGTHILEACGTPCGYVLSHPWRAESLPALNSLLGTLPQDADSYYLHDLALLPRARGTGAAGRIVADLVAHARSQGFTSVSLVAVNASRPFWERHGFAVRECPALTGKLESYERSARFMVRPLAG